MAANDFYEEQGRMDGPTCRFTKQQRIDFLNLLRSKNVLNIEMEAVTFAGLCRQANVHFAVICVGILNRLEGDQVRVDESMYEQFTDRLFKLVGAFITQKLKK
jgi:uridine phosphorylase